MINGFVTTNRYARVINLPVSFSQTELGSGKNITILKLPLAINQRFELRSLTIAMIAILTPGQVAALLNTAMGLCSVGLYQSSMLCSPLAYAAFNDQTSTANPFSPCVIETPGTYSVIVSNNTSNIDLAVVVTGSVKFCF